LAWVAGLGGGILRDILIDRGPPVAFTNHAYLPIVLAVAIIVSVVRGVELGPRGQGVIRVLDATAVGAFAVVAADRAHAAGFTIPACLFLGVIGGTGGLLMRDILVADTPEIFRRGELNGIAALAAAAAFIALIEAGVARPVPSVVGILVGFTLRLVALHFDLRAPAPRR
ncbi:MAG: TRIC cation channel family protein, partial [Patulibacter sp.]|nr:TRIC cation channel family protein [Patulibacter sp.]